MKLIKEAKRFQELAGINEIKIELPPNIQKNIEEFLDDMINISIHDGAEEGEEINGIWLADEYTDEDLYREEDIYLFKKAHSFISSRGGKITIPGNPDVTYQSLPNGDIGYSLIVTY